MNTPNYVLYYPSIEFQNYAWLCSAALLWDRIYRIVPEGYEPEDPDNVRVLTETGEIGIPIRPDAYARDTAREFLNKIESGEWSAAALEVEIPEAYARIHQDKVDVELRKMIITKGKATAHEEWLYVPVEFESLYMTYLAEQVSRRNNLPLLSDSAAAWTGTTFFKYNGEIEDFPRENLTQQLAILVVGDFIPQNILDIRPEDIVKFRERYRDERQRFIVAIRDAARSFSECEDETIYRDRLQDLQKEIEAALSDYRGSMQALNIAALTGIKSISFPVVTRVASEIAGHDLDVTTLSIISALGIGLGLVSGFSDWKHRRRKLKKESDFSYLMHLGRNWKGSAMYNNDYNYFLCREIEEFIND